jgi:hypothetical protein
VDHCPEEAHELQDIGQIGQITLGRASRRRHIALTSNRRHPTTWVLAP